MENLQIEGSVTIPIKTYHNFQQLQKDYDALISPEGASNCARSWLVSIIATMGTYLILTIVAEPPLLFGIGHPFIAQGLYQQLWHLLFPVGIFTSLFCSAVIVMKAHDIFLFFKKEPS